ncbi:MAG: hypothetical protein WA459_04175 [Stellaceae bacterium]
MSSVRKPPILAIRDHAAASVFEPANLLREARRQKGPRWRARGDEAGAE